MLWKNAGYYRLEDKDDVYGSYREKDGMVYATQHQWKWVKDKDAYNGSVGVEVLKDKPEKDSESFFKVMKKISKEEFNDLWGLNLERL